MPRRNTPPERVKDSGRPRTQRGKGRKRRSSWHQGAGSDMDVKARNTHLPATGAEADPGLATHVVHSSSDFKGGRPGRNMHRDAV